MRTRNAINNILALLLALVLTGCAACNRINTPPVVNQYENITANNIAKECKTPIEYHYIPGILVIEVPIQLARFKDCLGNPDLLIMNFLEQPDEMVRTYVHLMMILYVDSINETTGAVVIPALIKESRLTDVDGTPVPDDKEVWFIVYSLSPGVVEDTAVHEDTAP